jgi:cation:H+ antiporter
MDWQTAVFFVVGLVLLIVGAEVMIRGASRLAAIFGISPLVVGLTIVAFGTSAPELAVSIQGAWAGSPDVAVGNVMGSNVFNILVVLGLAALVAPLVVARQLIRIEVPLMIGATLVVWALSADGAVGRIDGALLGAAVIAYTVFAIRKSRAEESAVHFDDTGAAQVTKPTERERATAGVIALQVVLMVVGLAMLVFGADLLVESAVTMARSWGVSDRVIALTLIAGGTSLPEVATSIMASVRGERDIAVGNAVGSNLFNLLAVLGFSALAAPGGIPVSPASLHFDLPVALAVAVACLPVFFTGSRISRWEGALFISYYGIYLAFLLMRASESPWLQPFRFALVVFVLPLTFVTLFVFAWRSWQRRRAAARSTPPGAAPAVARTAASAPPSGPPAGTS